MIFEKTQLMEYSATQYSLVVSEQEMMMLPLGFEEDLVALNNSKSFAHKLYILTKIASYLEGRGSEREAKAN